ncbi:MAG: hypothetical protein KDA42_07075 [Planctomycetales bacterium]|nr:hypothetical protein [Planctomycetales bacterium]
MAGKCIEFYWVSLSRNGRPTGRRTESMSRAAAESYVTSYNHLNRGTGRRADLMHIRIPQSAPPAQQENDHGRLNRGVEQAAG